VYRGHAANLVRWAFASAGRLGPWISLAILEKRSGKQVDVILSSIRLHGPGAAWGSSHSAAPAAERPAAERPAAASPATLLRGLLPLHSATLVLRQHHPVRQQ
jgi:hypothetical protein